MLSTIVGRFPLLHTAKFVLRNAKLMTSLRRIGQVGVQFYFCFFREKAVRRPARDPPSSRSARSLRIGARYSRDSRSAGKADTHAPSLGAFFQFIYDLFAISATFFPKPMEIRLKMCYNIVIIMF